MIPFPIADAWLKRLTFGGGRVAPGPLNVVLRTLIESARAMPSFVIDSVVSIDQAPEAYKAFSEHSTGKTVIRFFP